MSASKLQSLNAWSYKTHISLMFLFCSCLRSFTICDPFFRLSLTSTYPVHLFTHSLSFAFFFLTQDCLQPFTDGCFMELDGRPLCVQHFHSRQGTLCGSCKNPITGRCISALDLKFHPEHFVCAFCLRQLSQGIFKEQKGKPYCPPCFVKLFL